MADLLPSARVEPLGDSPEHPADARRERPAGPKAAAKPAAVPPPLEAEPEEPHQLDELA
jgi:hypothetical protein